MMIRLIIIKKLKLMIAFLKIKKLIIFSYEHTEHYRLAIHLINKSQYSVMVQKVLETIVEK